MTFLIGDKGTAVCEECRAFVEITYKLRDVPFSDGSRIVKDLVVGVCDYCDSVVAIQHSVLKDFGLEGKIKSDCVKADD